MEEFNKLLNEYKTQYIQFVSTGDTQFKTAADKVMTAIEEAVQTKQTQVDSDKKAMNHFAASYAKGNQDLSDTIEDAQQRIQNAQDIHDEYVASKERYNAWTENPIVTPPYIDLSVGYAILLRIGVFLVLFPLFVYVGYITPTLSSFGNIST
jgi:hypothetical protein